MAQRVRPNSLPGRSHAQLFGTIDRRLHPAPSSRGMRLYDPTLTDIPVGQRTLLSAPCNSGCTGTRRDLPPLPDRTRIVGFGGIE